MPQPSKSRANRSQQLWRLSGEELLKLYNGKMGIPPGTVEDQGMPKEGMVRSILLKEGYEKEEHTKDDNSRFFGLY